MSRGVRNRLVVGLLALAALSVSCREESAPTESVMRPEASLSASVSSAGAEVLIGAGDIATCSNQNDEATAKLLDAHPGTVFTAGDHADPNNTALNFSNCYGPTWGRHLAQTRPVPGDRDYRTSGASGYFGYFGAAAGDPATGYYSYDLGAWHIVVLNSALGTSAASTQVKWLIADLAANGKPCTMALWHRPYVTSADVGGRPAVKPLWDVLHQYGADVIVNAHARVYERFAPQNPDLVADPAGIRQFIVGTGGRGTDAFAATMPNSEVRHSGTYGVLKFTLEATGYSWEFLPVAGRTFTDAGSGGCDAPAGPPVAHPGGPYSADDVVTFNGSGSSDPQGDLPLTYTWDFGDGTPAGSGVNPTHTYAVDSVYTASLVVTDASGESSAPASVTVTIANVAPSVTVQTPASAVQGVPAAVGVTFSDPGVTDSPWSYAIDWGDGSSPTTGTREAQTAIDESHTYAAAGTYTVTATVADADGGAGTAAAPLTVVAPSSAHVLIGAGDIAECGSKYWNQYDEATGVLLDAYPDATVFTAGDNAYPAGSAADYANCYEPAWGRHKSRTWAVLGNHEYDTGTADPTWDYFGERAGPRGKGYYSVDIGDWHLVVLNDNIAYASGSVQDIWLQNDLATTTKACTIAIWHQPMVWSADGGAGYRSSRKILWDRLYAAGAEIVLTGHQHFYERFAPMNPNRIRDDARGIRQFIVGTGGTGVVAPSVGNAPNSEVVGVSRGAGVLKLTLRAGSYDWEFIPIPGQTFTDSGSGSCH